MTAARRLAELAERFGGEILGDPDVLIEQVGTLAGARSGEISFLSQAKYRHLLASTKASALILPPVERDSSALPRIITPDPYLYFARVSGLFNPGPTVQPGIHPTAVIAPDAHVSPNAQVGPACHIDSGARVGDGARIGHGCTIGKGASVGRDSLLYPRVTIYDGCSVGDRAILHSGTVIGSDGFGIARDSDSWVKIPQIGRAIIGADVEIGANTTVDRGAIDDTVIEDGAKLDNQIQVGHNVRIGAHTAIAGCVGIAGSATIGRHCTIGGGAIILGHLRIADHVNISAGTVVTKSITSAGTYTGVFPIDTNRNWGQNAAVVKNLEAVLERIRSLEKKERGK